MPPLLPTGALPSNKVTAYLTALVFYTTLLHLNPAKCPTFKQGLFYSPL